MNRHSERWLLAFVLAFSVVPAAAAQEYATETGDLELEATVVITITLSGQGFVADSVVYVTAIGNGVEYDLGTLPTDDQGRFFGDIPLPEELDQGSFVINATGATPLGSTRVLSSPLAIGQEATALPPTEGTATTSSTPQSTTTQARRGDGLDPIETTNTPQPESESGSDPDVALFVLLGIGTVGLSGLWWWFYRMKSS